ncbi:MAG: TIGR03118 family protein [Acidobacteriota bacterium]
MKSLFPRRRSTGALAMSAFAAAFVIAALVSSWLPSSLARSHPSDTNNSQRAVDLSFVGLFRQNNLVSDVPGVALVEDPKLINPWGVALNSTSPFWVINNKADLATIYKGGASGSSLVPNLALPSVAIPNIPTVDQSPSQPTGVVANTTNDFVVSLTPTSPAAPAQFIFATLNGGINAWQPAMGAVAVVVKYTAGHSYTGIAIGNNVSGNFLFVADFANGKIDVFDKAFNVSSVSGNFTDPTIPANFHPYNIQNFGGSLYVTYAQFQNGPSSDLGYVRKFDTNGVRDAAFAINGDPLNSPWGMAIAPASFGAFGNALLVGNNHFGNGTTSPCISAFNPATGALIGYMVDGGGATLIINDLRALTFGNGLNGGDPNTLYFSAGNSSNRFGLFGSLTPITGIPASTIKFANREYTTSENSGHIDITVTRSGDTSGIATVNYATVDGSATQKSDYEIALGKLTFNPGESSKTFRVLVVDDKILAGGSSVVLNLVLSNPTGAALTDPNYAYLYLMDDEFDTPGQPPNILDDTQFFVRQQYFDFLNREPDASGFNFWTNQIISCGTDQQCLELRHINVSAAFFLSIEFQKTGMLAYLMEKAAFGGLPRYGSFERDVQALQKDYVFGAPGADAQLETNKQAFFDEFVTRPEFVSRYAGLSNENFVQTLFANGLINNTTAEVYIAQLNGAQVVPPTASPATGLVIFRQAVNTPTVSVSLYLNGLTSAETDAHIHGPAANSATGPVIVTLPTGQLVNFQAPLSNPQFLDLSAGRLYVDVHTTGFPGGEIRGQLPNNLFVPDMIIRSLNAGIITRAQALRIVAESDYFRANELNRAFVLMEYFGYLRRNPNDPPDNNLDGYNFWLNKLNQFNGNFVNAEMVKAFIKSTEYRGRFGPP